MITALIFIGFLLFILWYIRSSSGTTKTAVLFNRISKDVTVITTCIRAGSNKTYITEAFSSSFVFTPLKAQNGMDASNNHQRMIADVLEKICPL